ncbi:hypothetical protein C8R43DRAFT_88657 [Mycena crocata]|nr:hypothetical protein C8R43DRAFT_88657 [Mycena crocata]
MQILCESSPAQRSSASLLFALLRVEPTSSHIHLIALFEPRAPPMSASESLSIVKLTLPILIGTLMNWVLFGTLLVQILIYFAAFPKDRARWKFLVCVVTCLELIETTAGTRDVVRTLGAGWGDMDALDDVGWAWFSVPIMGSAIACIGQSFFAWRIYIIGHNIYISGLIMTLSTVQLGGGIWTGVNICNARKFSVLQTHNLRATSTWLAATALCDLVIVFSTVFYLVISRRPEFRRINSAVSRIVQITVETGLLCALFAIFNLMLFATFKGTNYHLALCIEFGKVYSNSILLILNSRAHIGHDCPPDINHLHISDIMFESRSFKSPRPDNPRLSLTARRSHYGAGTTVADTESTVSQGHLQFEPPGPKQQLKNSGQPEDSTF